MVPRGFLTSKRGIPHPHQVRGEAAMLSQQVTKPLALHPPPLPTSITLVSGLVPPTDQGWPFRSLSLCRRRGPLSPGPWNDEPLAVTWERRDAIFWSSR